MLIKSDQQGDPRLHKARLWLEQHWQPALVTAELENGWMVIFVHQAQPLFLNCQFFSTEPVAEKVASSAAAFRDYRHLGVGSRFH
jgi:hypothetical protein